jgi:monosaccharide-transporting ATPase
MRACSKDRGMKQMKDDIILSMEGIEITFPGVKALDKVDFCLRSGEIHALLGENGAGKSTLIKCLTGVHRKDAGTIRFNGKEINPATPQEAMELGISTVYQEVNLCPNLTVAENIFIGRQIMKHGQINWKEINRRSSQLMERFNIHIDVTRPLESFSTAVQQIVSIARAVDIKAKILILDEPTSSLDENEVERLFKVMESLRQEAWALSLSLISWTRCSGLRIPSRCFATGCWWVPMRLPPSPNWTW